MDEEYSFQRGLEQIRVKDMDEAKSLLMAAFNLRPTSIVSWNNHLRGVIVPRVDEAKRVESIFAKYGIKQIWGGKKQ